MIIFPFMNFPPSCGILQNWFATAYFFCTPTLMQSDIRSLHVTRWWNFCRIATIIEFHPQTFMCGMPSSLFHSFNTVTRAQPQFTRKKRKVAQSSPACTCYLRRVFYLQRIIAVRTTSCSSRNHLPSVYLDLRYPNRRMAQDHHFIRLIPQKIIIFFVHPNLQCIFSACPCTLLKFSSTRIINYRHWSTSSSSIFSRLPVFSKAAKLKLS